jgi:hypothetical protein
MSAPETKKYDGLDGDKLSEWLKVIDGCVHLQSWTARKIMQGFRLQERRGYFEMLTCE